MDKQAKILITGSLQDATVNIYPLGSPTATWSGITDATGKVVKSLIDPILPSLTYGDYTLEINKCDYDSIVQLINVPTDTVVSLTAGCSSAITTHETVYNHSLINGGINSYFNLLKIYSPNIFNETISGSGLITPDLANGSVRLDVPTNNSSSSLVEQSKSVLSGIPRIVMFRIGTFNFVSDSSYSFLFVGLSEFGLTGTTTGDRMTSLGHFTGVRIHPLGLNPRFYANSTYTYTAGIYPGDIIIIYATSTRCSLFVNGIHRVTHTTSIPTNTIGHTIGLTPAWGFAGAGSNVTIDYMS